MAKKLWPCLEFSVDMAVTSSDQRDYTQCCCIKLNGCKEELDAHSQDLEASVPLKKKNETPQNLSPMCTCVTVDTVRHSSLDPIAPTDIHGPTTTKVSAGIVTEGSRTAAITAKRNHMWTKVSVCASGREHVVPLNLRPGHREAESNMD